MTETKEKQTSTARKPKTVKVTLLKNIKFKNQRYKIGQQLEVTAEEVKQLQKQGVITGE